ncbi:hypothetical protein [Paraburkholderia sp.]|nr:hypothetical protein [Paraburkholderia sp.]
MKKRPDPRVPILTAWIFGPTGLPNELASRRQAPLVERVHLTVSCIN